MHDAEAATGLLYDGAAKLKVYPTVTAFRDATGEPGWVAASTRGGTIRLQPTDVLRDAGTIESTLRHELLHMLVDSHAKAGTPLWFREGLVLYLSQPVDTPKRVSSFDNIDALNKALRSPVNEQEIRRAYADAQMRITRLVTQKGRAEVIGWLQNGLPAAATSGD
jgi:stage II sporulation protein D